MSRADARFPSPCGIFVGDTPENTCDGTADAGKGVALREPHEGAKWALLPHLGLG